MLCFRLAFLALFALLLFPDAQNLRAQPAGGRPMRIKLSQDGSQVTVRLSYSDSFSGRVFGAATVRNGVATWTVPQGCVERFQSPGYNYDNPGLNTFTLSFLPADGQQRRPVLVYTQVTLWNVLCGNHRIGTEGLQKVLTND